MRIMALRRSRPSYLMAQAKRVARLRTRGPELAALTVSLSVRMISATAEPMDHAARDPTQMAGQPRQAWEHRPCRCPFRLVASRASLHRSRAALPPTNALHQEQRGPPGTDALSATSSQARLHG